MPELVAGPADIWTVAELADTVAILRSLAEVCDLEPVLDVLDSAEGFQLLPLGDSAFTGRTGEKLWNGIGAVVVERWDEVVDAVDAIVTTPEVDPEALAQAQAEFASVSKLALADAEESAAATEAGPAAAAPEADRAPELEFWDELGIDCISVTVDGVTGYTLRCYLGEEPVFLTESGRIQIFTDPELLATYLADAAPNHSMAHHRGVRRRPRRRPPPATVEIAVDPENTYRARRSHAAADQGPGGGRPPTAGTRRSSCSSTRPPSAADPRPPRRSAAPRRWASWSPRHCDRTPAGCSRRRRSPTRSPPGTCWSNRSWRTLDWHPARTAPDGA